MKEQEKKETLSNFERVIKIINSSVISKEDFEFLEKYYPTILKDLKRIKE